MYDFFSNSQLSQLLDASKIVGSRSGDLSFEGVGMKLDETNQLVFPICVGSPASYSWFPEEDINEFPLAIGAEVVLVAGLQARNNARIVVSGSLAMFSDTYQQDNPAQTGFDKNKVFQSYFLENSESIVILRYFLEY